MANVVAEDGAELRRADGGAEALEVLVSLQTETRHMTSNEWWDGRAGLTPNYVGVKYILRYEVPSSVPQKNTLRIIHN